MIQRNVEIEALEVVLPYTTNLNDLMIVILGLLAAFNGRILAGWSFGGRHGCGRLVVAGQVDKLWRLIVARYGLSLPAMADYDCIGIIAGNGAYPRTFVEAARRAKVPRLVVSAFKNETEPALEAAVDSCAWLRVGQLGKLIKFFHKEGVKHAVMVGQIAPKNLFELRPDIRIMTMLAKLKRKNAETIFGAIADELASEGIALLPATTFLGDCMPPVGQVCGPTLTKEQLYDASYGFGIAKEVSRLDIGQTVVVKKGTVLAVEAFEGTNKAIARGGELGQGKALVAKVSKPKQDFRFDVPVVGPTTIEAAAEAGVSAIVIEADCTLLLERDVVENLCATHKVSVFAMNEPEDMT